MARHRRPFLVVLALVLVAVVTLVVVQAATVGPKDPARFHEYLDRYGTGWSAGKQPGRPARDHRWLSAHPDATAAEGRRACHWLAARPDAPIPDKRHAFRADPLAARYAETHHTVPLALITRMNVAGAAWNFICPGVARDKTSTEFGQRHN